MAHEALTSEGTFWQVCSLQNPNMLATSPPIYSIYNSSQSIQWDLHRLWYFFKLLTFKVFIRGPIVFSVLNVTIKMWSFDGVSRLFTRNPWKYYLATHVLENGLPLWPFRAWLLDNLAYLSAYAHRPTSILRCVGVIQFVFHVLQLQPIRFTQRNLCCNNNSLMKHQQNCMLVEFLHWQHKFSQKRSLLCVE
jgi:hypothetical protein